MKVGFIGAGTVARTVYRQVEERKGPSLSQLP